MRMVRTRFISNDRFCFFGGGNCRMNICAHPEYIFTYICGYNKLIQSSDGHQTIDKTAIIINGKIKMN